MRDAVGARSTVVPDFSSTYKYSSTAVHVQVHTDHCSIGTGTRTPVLQYNTPVAGRQFFDVLLDLSLASVKLRLLAGLHVASPGSNRIE